MWLSLAAVLCWGFFANVKGIEVEVNQFGDSSFISAAPERNKPTEVTAVPETVSSAPISSPSPSPPNEVLLRARELLIEITRSNYTSLLRLQPLSVLIISDESDEHNYLLRAVTDAAAEIKQNPDYHTIQFLHLDARSEDCKFLVGDYTHAKEGVWNVRKSVYPEETIYPKCFSMDPKDIFQAQLWLFHWRDLTLMSPLRMTRRRGPDSMPAVSISGQLISSTVANLISMDAAYIGYHCIFILFSCCSDLVVLLSTSRLMLISGISTPSQEFSDAQFSTQLVEQSSSSSMTVGNISILPIHFIPFH
jgi:hypothetical protein